jgi:hypothetical protein
VESVQVEEKDGDLLHVRALASPPPSTARRPGILNQGIAITLASVIAADQASPSMAVSCWVVGAQSVEGNSRGRAGTAAPPRRRSRLQPGRVAPASQATGTTVSTTTFPSGHRPVMSAALPVIGTVTRHVGAGDSVAVDGAARRPRASSAPRQQRLPRIQLSSR